MKISILSKNNFILAKKKYIIYAFLIIPAGIILAIFLIMPEKRHASGNFIPVAYQGKAKNAAQSTVYLYFADKENRFLTAEERFIVKSDDPATFGKDIIDLLIKGPGKEHMRTIPKNTVINALYVTKNKTAFIDFGRQIVENHPGGIKSELFTIYSIVNSLILNIEEIERVKILIGGREAVTLAGHISLAPHFTADMLLIR